jgi:pyruvate dehydrogenase E1 component beta subunit
VAEYNGAYKVSKGMLEEFGASRIIDTPISESGFAGMAIGAAMQGLRPIVEFMSWSFSLVAADPILNNAPKMLYMSGGQFGCPIVFRGNDGAGGQLGSTHSWCVEGMYSNVPGLKMAIPATRAPIAPSPPGVVRCTSRWKPRRRWRRTASTAR